MSIRDRHRRRNGDGAAVSPRPGFVLEVDRSTPPTLFWHGEQFRFEQLPVGSRVIYPPEPLAALDDPDAAIRDALEQPARGLSAPLGAALCRACASRSPSTTSRSRSPRCARPTSASGSIEAVLDAAAEAGVDDVVLIAALALHRRMTDDELRHALGGRVFDAFAPNGPAAPTRRRGSRRRRRASGVTEEGEEVEINRRAAESDLLVYVNINLVAMDGGHKSVATGLASYN